MKSNSVEEDWLNTKKEFRTDLFASLLIPFLFLVFPGNRINTSQEKFLRETVILDSIPTQTEKKGLEIFSVTTPIKTSLKGCQNCFDENTVALSKNPILEEDDIESFNWKNQQIILSDSGKKKIAKIEIKLSGLPVVLVLNKKRIYGFWLWNNFSSFGCDRAFTYPKKDFKIRFGLPENNIFGEDPRFNAVLKKYVLSKFKQN